MTALKDLYKKTLVPQLQKQFNYSSVMQVPRITKVTLNMGLGYEAVTDKKVVDKAMGDLMLIAGQKCVKTLARKSIAGFKIREDWPLGCKVTLRKDYMYEFLQRLIFIAIPRVRDFRGLNSKAFDGRGNYSFGISEHIVFPEIDYDKIDKIRGLDICITTSAKTDSEARALLMAFGLPIKEMSIKEKG